MAALGLILGAIGLARVTLNGWPEKVAGREPLSAATVPMASQRGAIASIQGAV
jgi:hypothetical protein